MEITNRLNLPESLVSSVSSNYKPKEDRISVTDLIGPPMIRRLKIDHWDEMSEDVEDRIWLMMGIAFHDLMQKNSKVDSEFSITHQVNGYTLSGRVDVMADKYLYDYKVTSVWAYMFGIKKEWTHQLNVYAWMLAQRNIRLNGLKIAVVMRDWIKRKAKEENYPSKALMIVDIPMFAEDFAKDYIEARVEAHRLVARCTPEDKWERPTTYAVKKKGNVRAIRVLPSEEDAEKYILNNKLSSVIIETRPGAAARCQLYCPVNKFCPDYKADDTVIEE